MKEIKIMGGESIIITDSEANQIINIANSAKFISLSNGDFINVSSIVSIREPETEAFFMGNKMSKDGTKVFVQGEWKGFCGDPKLIEYKPKNNQCEETRMITLPPKT